MHGTPFSHVGIPFQSTPLMRGETLMLFRLPHPWHYFNPLPSCEGRLCRNARSLRFGDFNPLPSCEGRRYRYPSCAPCHYFNPLPSCEGRRNSTWILTRTTISIHSPHARGDLAGWSIPCLIQPFQSTPLMRGETAMASIVSIAL